METRAKAKHMEQAKRRLHFQHAFVVEPRGLSGGLCLLWNNKVEIQVLAHSPNFIHTQITNLEYKNDYMCTW